MPVLDTVRVKLGQLAVDRDALICALRQKQIGASVHFIPIPLHPFFRSQACLPHNRCPVALRLYPRLISLPLYPQMTESDVEYVAFSLRGLLQQYAVPTVPRRRPAATYTRAAGSVSAD
jgi:dTDP-4-amino-4,6-dideoxygalactose transaminase